MKVITVDNFHYVAENYIISHAHHDHIKGFKKYKKGKIIGSPITIDVLKLYNNTILDLFVQKIHPDNEYTIPNCKHDIKLYSIESNHCPGALMFYFSTPNKSIVYTGDFRINKKVEEFAQKFQEVEVAYIDTTYASPKYNFISQESAIVEIISIIKKNIGKKIYIGLYRLGKNKIINAIYEELKIQTYVNPFNAQIFKIVKMGKVVTTIPKDNIIYGVDLKTLWEILYDKKEEPNSIYIIPTGWTQTNKTIRNKFYLIPYSEHCDYYELQRFLKILKPKEYYPLHYFKGI